MFPNIRRYNRGLATLFVFSFLTHMHSLRVMKSIRYEHKSPTGTTARAR